jgi:hypothetical protein
MGQKEGKVIGQSSVTVRLAGEFQSAHKESRCATGYCLFVYGGVSAWEQ